MATIADNIRNMAVLVAEVKKETRLSETTILRIVDMNFALAQSQGSQSFGGEEDFDTTDEGVVAPEGVEGVEEGQLIAFPELEGDDEVLAAATPEEV